MWKLSNSIENPEKCSRCSSRVFVTKVSGETPSSSAQNKETPQPEVTTEAEGTSEDKSEPESELIERLVTAGINGNMDEINALENKVLRGKIKAAIVKAKRS